MKICRTRHAPRSSTPARTDRQQQAPSPRTRPADRTRPTQQRQRARSSRHGPPAHGRRSSTRRRTAHVGRSSGRAHEGTDGTDGADAAARPHAPAPTGSTRGTQQWPRDGRTALGSGRGTSHARTGHSPHGQQHALTGLPHTATPTSARHARAGRRRPTLQHARNGPCAADAAAPTHAGHLQQHDPRTDRTRHGQQHTLTDCPHAARAAARRTHGSGGRPHTAARADRTRPTLQHART